MAEVFKNYDMDVFTSVKLNKIDEDGFIGKKRTHEEAFGKVDETTPDKKPKLDEPEKTKENVIIPKVKEETILISCKAQIEYPDTIAKYLNRDILLNLKIFSDIICKCKTCTDKYISLNLSFLGTDFYNEWINRIKLEEQLVKEVEEDNIENKAVLDTLNTYELNDSNDIKTLPVEKVYYI
jgi:hypothetical protein